MKNFHMPSALYGYETENDGCPGCHLINGINTVASNVSSNVRKSSFECSKHFGPRKAEDGRRWPNVRETINMGINFQEGEAGGVEEFLIM